MLRKAAALPEDAMVLMSTDNDNPQKNVEGSHPSMEVPLVSVEGNVAVFEQSSAHAHNKPYYLGCIVTGDKSQVLWTNDSRPLPEQ